MPAKKENTKYIFVVGGVMSGVGKGVASASIGRLLQARGLNVTAMKIDPYVNVDAGTMNPTEHGEVFVLDDGAECDQDMGNYERFLDINLSRSNYKTTGSIYQSVINRERSLGYNGKCVEVVPHIPLEVISNIERAARKARADVITIEIGGTVGEYQNILFLEAVRMLKLKRPNDVVLILVSYLPTQGSQGELKTKPTQYAVRSLNSAGLQPDIIIGRAAVPLDKKRKEKIAFNCGLSEQDIISAPDVPDIYAVPANFDEEGITDRIIQKTGLRAKNKDLREWLRLLRKIKTARRSVRIGIVGKYFSTGDFVLADSYISVIEAVKHAAYALNVKPDISWLDATEFEPGKHKKATLQKLKGYDGIVVPGGFGSRGVEGKIAVIGYCRKEKIPFLGLCYGMQLAVVEFARNAAALQGANTTEVDPKSPHPVIAILPDQQKKLAEKKYGATMRLGAYPARLTSGTIAHAAYSDSRNSKLINERHRHRYEVNPDYVARLEKKGLIFSGRSPDDQLMEIAELPKKIHPFFLGTQFHPEFKSRPITAHPLFLAFMKAATRKNF